MDHAHLFQRPGRNLPVPRSTKSRNCGKSIRNSRRYIGPPCHLRAGVTTPICTEGSHFCGVKVWLDFPNVTRRDLGCDRPVNPLYALKFYSLPQIWRYA